MRPGVRLKKRGGADHPTPVGLATDASSAMEDAVKQDKSKATSSRGKRLASIENIGEQLPQEQWERFEQANRT